MLDFVIFSDILCDSNVTCCRVSSAKKAKTETKKVKKEPVARRKSTGSAAKVRILPFLLSFFSLFFLLSYLKHENS